MGGESAGPAGAESSDGGDNRHGKLYSFSNAIPYSNEPLKAAQETPDTKGESYTTRVNVVDFLRQSSKVLRAPDRPRQ